LKEDSDTGKSPKSKKNGEQEKPIKKARAKERIPTRKRVQNPKRK